MIFATSYFFWTDYRPSSYICIYMFLVLYFSIYIHSYLGISRLVGRYSIMKILISFPDWLQNEYSEHIPHFPLRHYSGRRIFLESDREKRISRYRGYAYTNFLRTFLDSIGTEYLYIYQLVIPRSGRYLLRVAVFISDLYTKYLGTCQIIVNS